MSRDFYWSMGWDNVYKVSVDACEFISGKPYISAGFDGMEPVFETESEALHALSDKLTSNIHRHLREMCGIMQELLEAKDSVDAKLRELRCK